MFLTNADITELTDWRRELHRHPELSGAEAATAARVVAMLGDGPDRVLTGLGGHGVAAVYEGAADGPTLLIRSEIDALPITEQPGRDHCSQNPGVGHLCGHDGHSTILAALARGLDRQRPARGRVVLLFQPAEETGAGAAGVIGDQTFAEIRPDMAISLHNMPGLPLGAATLQPGPFACASCGIKITFTGATTHAAQPEHGRSPAMALAELASDLTALSVPGGALAPGFRLATITHMNLGVPAFGIAPGDGELWATLRALDAEDMADLVARAEALATQAAADHGLAQTITYHEVFAASVNHPDATALLDRALATAGIPRTHTGQPMRASEDFGLFGAVCPSAMLLLGAGEATPQLHNEDYDFPDDLIAIGARIFMAAVRDYLG